AVAVVIAGGVAARFAVAVVVARRGGAGGEGGEGHGRRGRPEDELLHEGSPCLEGDHAGRRLNGVWDARYPPFRKRRLLILRSARPGRPPRSAPPWAPRSGCRSPASARRRARRTSACAWRWRRPRRSRRSTPIPDARAGRDGG